MYDRAMSTDARFLTNIGVYFAIAEEALQRSQELERRERQPKPHGEPGLVISFDPERVSFKQSLIAIVFAGIYLEALLDMEARKRFSGTMLRRFDRNLNYEKKLEALGITDHLVIAACK